MALKGPARLWAAGLLGAVGTLRADSLWLDDAVQLSREAVEGCAITIPEAGDSDVAGFSVDTGDRQAVAALYHCVYLASEGFEGRMGWTGNVAACEAGTVAAAFHDDTRRRINYFRAMAGLSADIAFDSGRNSQCQEAALMMSRNGALSHAPPVTWACYTAAGAEAAGGANLTLSTGSGYTGPRAIDAQVADAGAGNTAVGHRRWLLYTRAAVVGNGGIPGQGSYGSSAAIWVLGPFAEPPAAPAWTCWPNAGYTPYALVPGRWSFSMPGAGFDAATVNMEHDGAPVALTKVHPTPSSPAVAIGDPTVVWEPQGIPAGAPATDLVYTVTIGGIAGVTASTVVYTVTLMDPASLGRDLAIAGPATPFIGRANRYAFDPVPGTTACELRIRKLAVTNWTEGAENSPAPRILDGTSAAYSLIQSAVKRSGARAFQMAFPSLTFVDQWFEVDRTVVPASGSWLAFHFLRRFSAASNRLTAQVSTDDGATWTAAWSTNGVCADGGSCSSSAWDPAWRPASVALAVHAGAAVRLRFHLAHNSRILGGTTSSYGFFVDDIAVTGAQEVVAVAVTNLAGGASGFTLTPDGLYRYLIDLRIETGCHWFDAGVPLTVRGVPFLRVTQVRVDGGVLAVNFAVEGGNYGNYALLRAAAADGAWAADPGAVLDAGGRSFSSQAAPGFPFLRVAGELP